MKRTLALCAILKNERHNLERFLASFNGCVDRVYLTDTGSTDGSLDWIKDHAEKVVGCPVVLKTFQWCDDFSAARNFVLPDVTEDYWMWSDLDDVLAKPEFFKRWKSSAMPLADAHFVPYYYGWRGDDPVCRFARERVFKNNGKYRFKDFVHEGVPIPEGASVSSVTSWQIHHMRTEEDHSRDKGRNLRILIDRYRDLTPRLHCYLGKEFYDNGKWKEAVDTLSEVIKYPPAVLDIGDRVMAIQFLAMSYAELGEWAEVTKHAKVGTQLDPLRAEFYCLLGNAYFATNQLHAAIPWYRAATGCLNTNADGMTKLFSQDEMYNSFPRTQLAQIYFSLGMYDHAAAEADGIDNPLAKEVIDRSRNVRAAVHPSGKDISNPLECDDIVFTCLFKAYDWDEGIYAHKGLGGSETACVEMASWLAKMTKRTVKVFSERNENYTSASGVKYLPLKEVEKYFIKWKPSTHVKWRHSAMLGSAQRTLLWCHDLYTPGGEVTSNYDKMLCLSEFHKSYVQAIQGVEDEKILLTRNGVAGGRFENLDVTSKQYAKVIWPNSPDRGLDYAIQVMDEVRKSCPGAELHVFYGMENMEKDPNFKPLADKLKAMMSVRPWVKYHGNVDQKTLAKEFASSEVWLYTANFIESFCITALESLGARCWPVVRDIGALPHTLAKAKSEGMAEVLDYDTTPENISKWAGHVVEAIELRKWQDIHYDMEQHTWESVAKDWIKEFDL